MMMNEDRKLYEQYVAKINKMLHSEEFYTTFQKKLKASTPTVKLMQKHRNKIFDLDWVKTIEEILPHIDNIVRNPRKFIVIEEDIVDISLARSISTESVKHLAQHTNMIASVDKDGMVTPNKILNTTKEESYEIYENRFIYTLLKNLNQFVTRRMDAIKASYVNDHVVELDVDASVFTGRTRVFYKLELIASMPMDELKETTSADLTVVERIAKIQRILAEFSSSAFCKQMVNSSPVRPPIARTNVILKNPDFKKALLLWQFVESYTKMGFTLENEIKTMPLDSVISTNVQDMVFIGSMLMQGLVDGQVTDDKFFKESLMEENDLGKSDEKEKDETPQDTPETSEEETLPEDSHVDEDKDDISNDRDDKKDEDTKDEEIEETMPILENRSVFQRNNEEKSLSKAEIIRINKAIDRVITREKSLRLDENIEILNNDYSTEKDKEAIALKLTREKEARQKAMERKIKLAEKERQSYEKLLAHEQTRLDKLDRQIEKTLNSKITTDIIDSMDTTLDTGMTVDNNTTLDTGMTVDNNTTLDTDTTVNNSTILDTGTTVDYSTTLDTGTTVDNKTTLDTGTTVDYSTTLDTGMTVDNNTNEDIKIKVDKNTKEDKDN